MSDIIDKNNNEEEEVYLKNILMELLMQYGPSCEEDEALDFVERELKKIDPKFEIQKDKQFGLYCIIPSEKETHQSIIIDAHIDTVLHTYKKPELFLETVNDKQRLQICATGLDNRIHCALMITLAKFVRFEHTTYVLVFSTMEEIGKLGVFHFSRNIDLLSKYNNNNNNEENNDCLMGKEGQGIKKIIVLDVCRGKLFGLSGKKQSVVGGGFVTRKSTGKTNYYEYEKGFYNGIPKILYGVICTHMHKYNSIASLSDTFELYQFLKTNYIEPDLLKEEFTRIEDEETNDPEEDKLDVIEHQKIIKQTLEDREKIKLMEKEALSTQFKHLF